MKKPEVPKRLQPFHKRPFLYRGGEGAPGLADKAVPEHKKAARFILQIIHEDMEGTRPAESLEQLKQLGKTELGNRIAQVDAEHEFFGRSTRLLEGQAVDVNVGREICKHLMGERWRSSVALSAEDRQAGHFFVTRETFLNNFAREAAGILQRHAHRLRNALAELKKS